MLVENADEKEAERLWVGGQPRLHLSAPIILAGGKKTDKSKSPKLTERVSSGPSKTQTLQKHVSVHSPTHVHTGMQDTQVFKAGHRPTECHASCTAHRHVLSRWSGFLYEVPIYDAKWTTGHPFLISGYRPPWMSVKWECWIRTPSHYELTHSTNVSCAPTTHQLLLSAQMTPKSRNHGAPRCCGVKEQVLLQPCAESDLFYEAASNLTRTFGLLKHQENMQQVCSCVPGLWQALHAWPKAGGLSRKLLGQPAHTHVWSDLCLAENCPFFL